MSPGHPAPVPFLRLSSPSVDKLLRKGEGRLELDTEKVLLAGSWRRDSIRRQPGRSVAYLQTTNRRQTKHRYQ